MGCVFFHPRRLERRRGSRPRTKNKPIFNTYFRKDLLRTRFSLPTHPPPHLSLPSLGSLPSRPRPRAASSPRSRAARPPRASPGRAYIGFSPSRGASPPRSSPPPPPPSRTRRAAPARAPPPPPPPRSTRTPRPGRPSDRRRGRRGVFPSFPSSGTPSRRRRPRGRGFFFFFTSTRQRRAVSVSVSVGVPGSRSVGRRTSFVPTGIDAAVFAAISLAWRHVESMATQT